MQVAAGAIVGLDKERVIPNGIIQMRARAGKIKAPAPLRHHRTDRRCAGRAQDRPSCDGPWPP